MVKTAGIFYTKIKSLPVNLTVWREQKTFIFEVCAVGSHELILVLNSWSHGGRACCPDTPGMVITAYLLIPIFEKRNRELLSENVLNWLPMFRSNFVRICTSILSAYLTKGWYWKSWLREVGEGGSSTKKNKWEGCKNGPKRLDVYCGWSLFKIAPVTDLVFRYAKLVHLRNFI